MKKILLAASIALFAISCGNEKATDTTTQSMSEPAQEEVAVSAEDIKAGKVDPVCEMTYDAGWVENTIYMNDTIRFCSENCKTAFVARPEKYLKTAN
jgi:YHS domain-containing protein